MMFGSVNVAKILPKSARSAFILIAVQIGASEEPKSTNVFLRTGEHSGVFLRAEFGLAENVTVERYGGNLPRVTYHTEHGINFGLGYSLVPRLIAHLNADLWGVRRGSVHNLNIISLGPGCTWYTPIANTFITGNLYYSLLGASGGDPATIYDRWRVGVGKEVLIFKHLGAGVLVAYEGGRWVNGSQGDPKWELSGVRLNFTLTVN